MAKQIGLESIQVYNAPRVNTGTDAIVRGVQSAASDIASGVAQRERANQQAIEKAVKEIRSADRAEAARIAAEEKAAMAEQEARDKIRAEDELGKVQRDYYRAAQDLEESWIGDKTSTEFEKAKKDLFDDLLNKSGNSLSPKVRNAMKKSGKDWINAKLYADLQQAYRDELKAAEQSYQNIQDNSIQLGNEAGKAGDVLAGRANFAMSYDTLKDYADKTAKEAGGMRQFGKDYMQSFLTGIAESDPETAEQLLKPEALAWFTQGNYEKDKSYYDKMSSDLSKTVDKAIQRGKAIKKQQAEDAAVQEKTIETLDFMKNPIVMASKILDENDAEKADISDALKRLGWKAKPIQNKAREIYDLSNKVGDGKVPAADINNVLKQVASITLGDNGQAENNLMKAMDANIALTKAGANPQQLEVFNSLLSKALTDGSFKMELAQMLGKPSFDSIYLNENVTRKFRPFAAARTEADDIRQYVDKQGQQAYFGAMERWANGDFNGAMQYYDKVLEDTADYVQGFMIDVDSVKKQLDKMGSAMVQLNGNMTKIVGRLPNGEFIVESTGEKINGRI